MKLLSNEDIIFMIDGCGRTGDASQCEDKCPLFKECLHYLCGENCGSVLETDKE